MKTKLRICYKCVWVQCWFSRCEHLQVQVSWLHGSFCSVLDPSGTLSLSPHPTKKGKKQTKIKLPYNLKQIKNARWPPFVPHLQTPKSKSIMWKTIHSALDHSLTTLSCSGYSQRHIWYKQDHYNWDSILNAVLYSMLELQSRHTVIIYNTLCSVNPNTHLRQPWSSLSPPMPGQ